MSRSIAQAKAVYFHCPLLFIFVVNNSTVLQCTPPFIQRDVLSTKVFVGYLPETLSKKELVDLFKPYGTVVECDIVKDFAFLVSINYVLFSL